jgi:preprotein translocase subunit YajC
VILEDAASGLLLAEAADGGGGSFLTSALPILLIFVLWMMLMRPQQSRRDRETRASLHNTHNNHDRVLTSGGMYGVVTNVQLDADEVTVRIDESNNTRVRMKLDAIVRVIGDETVTDKVEKKDEKNPAT